MIFIDLLKFFLLKSLLLFKHLLLDKKFSNKDSADIFKNYVDQLKKEGFVIINNFLSKEDCDSIIKDMDNFYKKYPDQVWSDALQAEYRIHGSEKVSKKIYSFFSNQKLLLIGSYCCNLKIGNLMTMANRILYKPKNLGSGGGWHRDDIKFQFKAILYLVDTYEGNGPFQLIKNSNKFNYIVADSIKHNIRIFNTRLSEEVIQEIVSINKDRLVTITGKVGTLILVDTSLMHRGSPLTEKNRYALTNYYYPENKLNSMKGHFLPLLEKDYY
jgi:hypothetical protein